MIDHDKAFAMYWDLDDGRWLREAPLTDHHGIMGILRRIATKLEEDYAALEMLRKGNAAIVRERDSLIKERDDARTEARALEQQLDTAVADHKRILTTLADTAREMYKGGD